MAQAVGKRLRRFRIGLKISLREAARQLHVAHPALKDWEDETQTPSPPYREAIERWSGGSIKATDWPVSARERDMAAQAAAVRPAVSARDSRLKRTGTDS